MAEAEVYEKPFPIHQVKASEVGDIDPNDAWYMVFSDPTNSVETPWWLWSFSNVLTAKQLPRQSVNPAYQPTLPDGNVNPHYSPPSIARRLLELILIRDPTRDLEEFERGFAKVAATMERGPVPGFACTEKDL